MTTFKEGDNAW